MPASLGEGDIFWIWVRPAAAYLGYLLIGQAQGTLILRFHQLHNLRDIGLSLGRPRQDAIQ
jgi:hypothetical protein